jgi:dCMP deaminase
MDRMENNFWEQLIPEVLKEMRPDHKWDHRFIEMASNVAGWSKDSTQVGCVLVGESREILSVGYNGFPRGVEETPERSQRPAKYLYTEHAERNAIFNAVRVGTRLENATAYSTLFPCADCARSLIQSGITRVVAPIPEVIDPKWSAHWDAAMEMFFESKVIVDGTG